MEGVVDLIAHVIIVGFLIVVVFSLVVIVAILVAEKWGGRDDDDDDITRCRVPWCKDRDWNTGRCRRCNRYVCSNHQVWDVGRMCKGCTNPSADELKRDAMGKKYWSNKLRKEFATWD